MYSPSSLGQKALACSGSRGSWNQSVKMQDFLEGGKGTGEGVELLGGEENGREGREREGVLSFNKSEQLRI